MSGTRYGKAKAVVIAAEFDEKNFGDLAVSMDETGNVNAAHTEMKRRKGANGKKHRYPA
jgi:hypothetical protein